MSRIVFLVEEPSMKALLDELLPRLFPDLTFLCVPHEGKGDLEKSVPRKLKAWQEPGVTFVVVRDQDRDDCKDVKRRLVELCEQGGRPDTLVRVVCQELEAWYLGEPAALAAVYSIPTLAGLNNRAKFRNPDSVLHPSKELAKLVPQFQKVNGARRMGQVLTAEANLSPSFRVFVEGVRRILER